MPGLIQKEDEFYIIGELTINPNADFSKLVGFADKISDRPDPDTSDKDSDTKDGNTSDNVNKEIKSTTDEETNPKTGIENNYLILGISLILGIFMLTGISQKEVFRKI